MIPVGVTITVDRDRTETVRGNETITIDKDRTETVQGDGTIPSTRTVRKRSKGMKRSIVGMRSRPPYGGAE